MNSWALLLHSSGEVQEVDPVHACTRHVAHGPFVWVHLDAQEADAVAWLESHAQLESAPLAALTAVETRPRTETFGAGALVNLRGLAVDPEQGDALVSIRIWAEKGRVISVSFRPLAALAEARAKMQAGALKDPGDLVAGLARLITDELNPDVAQLGDTLDECESDLDPGKAFEMRRQIARIRSTAINYRRFVLPERQALERLVTLEADWLEEDDRIHLRGAADGFARMAEELEAVRERSALMHEQLTDLRAEQTETRTLVLSIVALVFLPLTFLTGLLGMNVEGIPGSHQPWAFAAVCGICVAVAGVITAYFVRAHWFRT